VWAAAASRISTCVSRLHRCAQNRYVLPQAKDFLGTRMPLSSLDIGGDFATFSLEPIFPAGVQIIGGFWV